MTLPLLNDDQIEEIVDLFGRRLVAHPTVHKFYGEDVLRALRDTLKGATHSKNVIVTLHDVLDECTDERLVSEVTRILDTADTSLWTRAKAHLPDVSDPAFYQPVTFGDLERIAKR